MDALYAKLLREGRSDGKGGLSARSVRYTHTVLRRAFKDAVRKQLIPRDPTDAADPPSASAAKAPTMRTWSAVDVGRFLAAVADDRLHAAWLVAGSTGMRRGEVLGIRWRDLDLDGLACSLSQTVIEGNGAPRLSTPKGGRGRSVALDPRTVDALREHRKAQLAERLAIGPGWQDNDLVFCREDGSPIWPRTFSRAFRRTPSRPSDRRSACTTCDIRGRRSRLAPACTRRSFRSASGTRRSRSRSTSTATRSRRCTRTLPDRVAALFSARRYR